MSAEFGFGWKENSCLVTQYSYCDSNQIKNEMNFFIEIYFGIYGSGSTNNVLWIIKKKTLEKETFWYLAAFSCLIGY